jgi:hypothetical protein
LRGGHWEVEGGKYYTRALADVRVRVMFGMQHLKWHNGSIGEAIQCSQRHTITVYRSFIGFDILIGIPLKFVSILMLLSP